MNYTGPERRAVPEHWLSAQIREIRQEARDTRAEMNAGLEKLERKVDKLGDKLDQHAKDDLEVEERVARIETQRAEEEKQAVKRGTLIAVVAGAAAAMIADLVKSLFTTKGP